MRQSHQTKSRAKRSQSASSDRRKNGKPTQNQPLDKRSLRFLRSLAHALKPVVRLGQHGLTDAVRKELDGALSHHELVKVKLSVSDKQSRLDQLDALCLSVEAVCVQQIGHTATLFRRNAAKPVIDLSLGKRS